MLDKLVDLIIQFLELFRFFYVVYEYKRGVLFRFGKFVRVLEPGLHFMLPFNIDCVMTETISIRVQDLGALATTTTDGKQVGFEVVVTFRIKDVKDALINVDKVEDAIKDACLGVVGTICTALTWDEVKSENVSDKLTTACRKRGWKYGVEIISVQLAGVSLVRNIRLMNTQHHKTE
jgi:regulator of protease activity HflC (stomatin/prohibitin superfamily)